MTPADVVSCVPNYLPQDERCRAEEHWENCQWRCREARWTTPDETIQPVEVEGARHRGHFPPHGFGHISAAVQSSRGIMDLRENWDGEGSPGYDERTWSRGVRFLLALAERVYRNPDFRIVIDAPQILPGPDGSLDLHWKTDSYELLVNVPSDSSEQASYYGDNLEENMSIKGMCDPAQPDRKLIAWLGLIK